MQIFDRFIVFDDYVQFDSFRNHVNKLKIELSLTSTLFVTKDGNDICLVCFVQNSEKLGDQWVIAKTSVLTLMKFVENELTLQEALTFVDDEVVFCAFKNKSCGSGPCEAKFNSLDNDMFPMDKRALRFNDMKGRVERKKLDKQIKNLYLRFFLGESIY